MLLGIVTVDDILDVSEEEVNEDFQKASAISPIEESYYSISATMLYKKRIGWLLILLITDFLSSGIIAYFENAIKAVIALAFFIPVLIDSGGNIAAQSSTLIIRALATGELTIKNWFNVVKKELLIGMMIGIILGFFLAWRPDNRNDCRDVYDCYNSLGNSVGKFIADCVNKIQIGSGSH
ncbi:MAG: hypothetical protein DRH24_12610 [Deltaproteobacteria bacterium]|nr:MAG: hypothetical protein DRH24_12610 [Deltaproteobacteria bacterium]